VGVPQAFTFMLINISDHDVRIPSDPVVDCGSGLYTGSLWLALKFTPLVPGPHGNGTRCIADLGDRPTIMERIKSWKVVGPGESLSIEENKDRLPYKEKEAGTYEFWAVYTPAPLSNEEQAQLRQSGIDFPHDKLSSAHITFVKKP
jgi:hypothetical protein